MEYKASTLLASLCSMAFLLVACGGGGGAAGLMTFAPESDFNIIVGAAPARIFASALFKEAVDEIDAFKDGYKKLKDSASDVGIELEQLQSVAILAAIDKGLTMAYLCGSKRIDPKDYVDHMEETNMLTKYKEEEANGQTYWVNERAGAFTEIAGGLAIFSKEDLLKDALDALKKGKGKLAASKEYNEALPLVDLNADAYLLIWDDIEIEASDVERVLKTFVDDEGDVADAAGAFEEIEAFGLYGYLRDGTELHGKIRFGDKDDAKTVKDFYDDYGDDVIKKIVPQLGSLAKIFDLGIEPDDIENILKGIKVEQRGSVLEVSLSVEGDDVIDLLKKVYKQQGEEAETAAPSTERDRQARTVENVRHLGQAIERYAMDHPRIGLPKLADVEALAELMIQLELITDRNEVRDGWGNLLVYEYDASGQTRSYTVTSYGADGRPGPAVEPGQRADSFEYDIIYSNGRFVQNPQQSGDR